jgi:hypothetical protein
MQHIGKVRRSARHPPGYHRHRRGDPARPSARGETSRGYVDVVAGLVLQRKQFAPMAQQLFSTTHPHLRSQNRVEEAVLAQALGVLRRLGLAPIVVADRGLGRKDLLIKLAERDRDLAIRIDADVLARPEGASPFERLDTLLGRQAWLGQIGWDRGQEGKLPCLARTVRATLRHSPSGRVADYREAPLNFLELVPLQGPTEPLVLATTLPTARLPEARGVAAVYAQRWSIEASFQTMKAWGLGRFMVREWTAIDRLLWIVMLAFALLVFVRQAPPFRRLRAGAIGLLTQLAVLGRQLTVGKLAEALSLDFAQHPRSWLSLWRS